MISLHAPSTAATNEDSGSSPGVGCAHVVEIVDDRVIGDAVDGCAEGVAIAVPLV